MKARHAPLQHGRSGSAAQALSAGAVDHAHHSFVLGSGLLQQWAGRECFTVCASSFGGGAGFLALWRAWRDATRRPQRLHVLALEAHPLSYQELAAALAAQKGDLREMADALLRQWPLLLPGLHRLEFETGSLTLTLAFGQPEHMVRQVDAGVDVFFLDDSASAPSAGPASRAYSGQLVRLANQAATAVLPGGGGMQRGLAAAGFLISEASGAGEAQKMARAVLRPGLGRPLPLCSREAVIVVGAGLAGAGVAHALALRGHAVTVLDPAFAKGPAGSHEGHRSAAMTPALSRDDNPMSRLSRAGILLSRLRWRDMPDVGGVCGSLVRIDAHEAGQWRRALAEWNFPPEWALWCEAGDTQARCGLPLAEGGVWMPAGTLLRPARLVCTLLAHAKIDVKAWRVAGLRRQAQAWQALDAAGQVLAEAPRVVLAAAADTPALLAGALPAISCPKLARVQRMGGQVGHFRAEAAPPTRAIVAGAGYWLPADAGVHVGGSTYDFDLAVSQPTRQGFQAVAAKVAALLEVDPATLAAAAAEPDGWAGWRAAVSDHLPVIGPVDAAESLWLACAYGSRGLSWMTLAGEIMAARLNGEPLPVERELLRAVKPR